MSLFFWGLGIARIEKSSIALNGVGKKGSEMAGLAGGGPTLKERCTYINKEAGYGFSFDQGLPLFLMYAVELEIFESPRPFIRVRGA